MNDTGGCLARPQSPRYRVPELSCGTTGHHTQSNMPSYPCCCCVWLASDNQSLILPSCYHAPDVIPAGPYILVLSVGRSPSLNYGDKRSALCRVPQLASWTLQSSMAITFQLELAHRTCRWPSMDVKVERPRESALPSGTLGPDLVATTLRCPASFLVQGPSLTDWCVVRLNCCGPRRLTARVTIGGWKIHHNVDLSVAL